MRLHVQQAISAASMAITGRLLINDATKCAGDDSDDLEENHEINVVPMLVPLYVTVREDLSVAISEEEVRHMQLRGTLDRATGGDRDARVFLRADRSIAYGDLMNVMNFLRMAGYLKIALVGLEGVPDAAGTEDTDRQGQ